MIDKHFRLTEEAVEQIGRRDKIRYPTESRFIADAVSAFSEKADNKNEEKELKRLCRKLERFIQWLQENTPWDGQSEPADRQADPYDYLDGI